ncbi:MAG: hypothetical protein FJ387_04595 [Verrucomicrobia bacterium]|nr:hypothetical protein [Verrucomicrobiota bacterium]
MFLHGVGNRVAHNRIHDAPHNAVLFWGNDHLLEFNEVYRVCMDTGDAGAFYIGRDWTQRGHVIRYNDFHDLGATLSGESGFNAVMAVYLDDTACGTTVYGNIMRRINHAILIGGGRMPEAIQKLVTVTDNLTKDDPGLVSPDTGDFRLKDDSASRKLGFKPIPFEKIGLYRDEYR